EALRHAAQALHALAGARLDTDDLHTRIGLTQPPAHAHDGARRADAGHEDIHAGQRLDDLQAGRPVVRLAVDLVRELAEGVDAVALGQALRLLDGALHAGLGLRPMGLHAVEVEDVGDAGGHVLRDADPDRVALLPAH